MGLKGSKSKVKESLPAIQKNKVVFVMGGPGSGKRTQCEKIAEKYGFTHLSTRDLVKAAKESGSEHGKKLVEASEKGEPIPMEVVYALLKETIQAKTSTAKGFVIDGYPEQVEQATKFENEIVGCEFVVYLEATDETMTKRLLAHAETSGSTEETEESIKTRIETFHTATAPLLEHFEKIGKLKKIAADGEVDGVFAEVSKLFDVFTVEDQEVKTPDDFDLKNAKVLFIVGGPGSGKGTQCANIVEKYGFCHISSGDLLREEAKADTERGRSINEIMQKGELVSMDIVLALLKEKMQERSKETKCFLIDGYPREVEQGTRFENEIVACTAVLYFDATDDTMTTRLLDRAKTSGRVDDNEESIKKRVDTFHNQTKPVVSHYEDQQKLVKISAEGSVDEVFQHVQTYMDQKSW